jgi:hypothetical protein
VALTIVLNVGAVVISLFALGASTWLASRQSVIQEQSNSTSVIVGVFTEFRSPAFREHYDFVCRRLGTEHPVDGGISGLPKPARDAVYDVAYLFSTLATLSGMGMLNEREVLALFRVRIIAVWDAIAPYVERERELNPTTGGLSMLQVFAAQAKALPVDPGALPLHWSRRGRWTTRRLVRKHWREAYEERFRSAP